MVKGRNVKTEKFFTTCQRAKKTISNIGTMYKIRHELPTSTKCLKHCCSSEYMKSGDVANLNVFYVSRKQMFEFLIRCACLLGLTNMGKKPNQWNSITRSKVVARCCSLQHSGLFVWQASMLFVLDKNKQVTRFQDETSCSSFLQNYVRLSCVQKSSRNVTIARPRSPSTTPKN